MDDFFKKSIFTHMDEDHKPNRSDLIYHLYGELSKQAVAWDNTGRRYALALVRFQELTGTYIPEQENLEELKRTLREPRVPDPTVGLIAPIKLISCFADFDGDVLNGYYSYRSSKKRVRVKRRAKGRRVVFSKGIAITQLTMDQFNRPPSLEVTPRLVDIKVLNNSAIEAVKRVACANLDMPQASKDFYAYNWPE